jgi:hypothetical protein
MDWILIEDLIKLLNIDKLTIMNRCENKSKRIILISQKNIILYINYHVQNSRHFIILYSSNI